MNHGRKWPKPVKPKRTTTTVIPTTQSERQQQLQRQKSQKEEKKKKIGNVIDSLLGMSLMGALGGGEVAPPKKEAHHKKRDPEPAFPIGQMVASHSQYTVETDKGGCCRQRDYNFHCFKSPQFKGFVLLLLLVVGKVHLILSLLFRSLNLRERREGRIQPFRLRMYSQFLQKQRYFCL